MTGRSPIRCGPKAISGSTISTPRRSTTKAPKLVRMIQTLIGRDGFRRGMDLYIQRHDNHAATIEDFVAAMQDAGGVDLGRFKLWYAQAGTPEITVADRWDAASGSYELEVDAEGAADPGAAGKAPMLIPLAIGLLGRGRRANCRRGSTARPKAGPAPACWRLPQSAQSFRFVDCARGAGAVAAARLFGAGQIEGRAARPAEISRGARPRAVRPLGGGSDRSRPASCSTGSRPCARGSAPAPLDPDLIAAMRQHPGRGRARPGLCRRGADPAERVVSRRPDGGRRCRCDPCRARSRTRRDRRALWPAEFAATYEELRRFRPLPDRRRVDRPAGVAQCRLAYLAAADPDKGAALAKAQFDAGRQHDRRAGGACGAGRSRPARARRGVGAFLRASGRRTSWSSTNGSACRRARHCRTPRRGSRR